MKIDVRGDASLYGHVLALFSDLERAWAEIARTPAPPAPSGATGWHTVRVRVRA